MKNESAIRYGSVVNKIYKKILLHIGIYIHTYGYFVSNDARGQCKKENMQLLTKFTSLSS